MHDFPDLKPACSLIRCCLMLAVAYMLQVLTCSVSFFRRVCTCDIIRLSKVEASPERCWLRNYYWLHANTDRAVLCAWDRVHGRVLTHVCDTVRCEDEVWVVVFHLALLNDFGRLASWMSVKSHESAHCSIASPSLYVLA